MNLCDHISRHGTADSPSRGSSPYEKPNPRLHVAVSTHPRWPLAGAQGVDVVCVPPERSTISAIWHESPSSADAPSDKPCKMGSCSGEAALAYRCCEGRARNRLHFLPDSSSQRHVQDEPKSHEACRVINQEFRSRTFAYEWYNIDGPCQLQQKCAYSSTTSKSTGERQLDHLPTATVSFRQSGSPKTCPRALL